MFVNVNSEILFPNTQDLRTLFTETWLSTAVSQSSAGIVSIVVSDAAESFTTVPAYLYFQLIVWPLTIVLVNDNSFEAVISYVDTSVAQAPVLSFDWTVTSIGVAPVFFNKSVEVAVWFVHVPKLWVTVNWTPQSTSTAPPARAMKFAFVKAVVL